MKKRFWRRPAVWVGAGVFLLVASTAVAGEIGALTQTAVVVPTVSSSPTASAVASAEPAASAPAPTPTPTPTPTVAPRPVTGTALALLQTIPVKGRAPKTGYDRTGMFGPAWEDVDRNGCDTRNDILRRDLVGIAYKPGTHGCVVLTGTLHDPYTGTTIAFRRGQGTSTAVQIDHVVALMNAWQSGAQQIGQAARVALANDPLNLLAVDGPTNEQKGAGDAATWLPPAKGVRCAYVARQITVKAKYRLWVTAAERDAMVRILGTCPRQPVAASGPLVTAAVAAPSAPVAPAPAPAQPVPAPAPAQPAPAQPAPAPAPAPKVVRGGSFCAPLGATGVTAKGTPMRCTSPDGAQPRWRAG